MPACRTFPKRSRSSPSHGRAVPSVPTLPIRFEIFLGESSVYRGQELGMSRHALILVATVLASFIMLTCAGTSEGQRKSIDPSTASKAPDDQPGRSNLGSGPKQSSDQPVSVSRLPPVDIQRD